MAPTAVLPAFNAQAFPFPKRQPLSTAQPTSSDPSKHCPEDTIFPLRAALTNETTPLAIRFRALFTLKHHASLHPPTYDTLPAIRAIAAAFASSSALLKHELAYCLGQSGNLASVPFLRAVILDQYEDTMCRHEAVEALGALEDKDSLDLLRGVRDSEAEGVVRETAEIAVERIEWAHGMERKTERLKESDFKSVDPAPPLAFSVKGFEIPELEKMFLDTTLSLFERYRAMFALRDKASPPDLPTAIPAVLALAAGFTDPSALFRHEIAFVFGQLSHPTSIPSLVQVLRNRKEESMVRHEAAEALGSLGDEEGVEDVLREFLNDPEQVVRESVVVALDMAEFEKNGQREYACLPAHGEEGFSPIVKV